MLKFFTEIFPVIAFFIGYKYYSILEAAMLMLAFSAIGIVVTYIKERKVNTMSLVSCGLILASVSLTLFSGNTIFIKMKPTVLYSLFALIFLVTTFKWQPAIKFVLGKTLSMNSDNSWRKLNIRFMLFFIAMAIANEIIWRNFSEQDWVNFKVFGALPLTLLFMLSQMPFIISNKA